jgi:hypothetical protein
MKALALALAAFPLMSVAPASEQCQPVQVVIQTPSMPPNSTYDSHSEPPKRFGYTKNSVMRVAFGQANIDAICGKPPCERIFLGCTRGDVVVLPDPFTTSDEQFARITRHELAHANGWPASHGD